MTSSSRGVRLLSVRQVATLTGLTKHQLWYALKHGRITGAQLVDGRWIIPEDFRILRSGMEKDPLLASLPDEFISTEPVKDWRTELPENIHKGNPESLKETRSLYLRGYEKAVEGLSMNEVYLITKVHPATQIRIRKGEKVRAKVALRLAVGLGIPVEELI